MAAGSIHASTSANALLFDGQDFLALVIAARGAHGVRALDLATLRANGAANRGALVIGRAAGMRHGPASFTLGYCHRYLPFLPQRTSSHALTYSEHANQYGNTSTRDIKGFFTSFGTLHHSKAPLASFPARRNHKTHERARDKKFIIACARRFLPSRGVGTTTFTSSFPEFTSTTRARMP